MQVQRELGVGSGPHAQLENQCRSSIALALAHRNSPCYRLSCELPFGNVIPPAPSHAGGKHVVVLPVIVFLAEKTRSGFEHWGPGARREADTGCAGETGAVHASSWFQGGTDDGAGSKRLLLRPDEDLHRWGKEK